MLIRAAFLLAVVSGEKRQALLLRHCVRSTAHDADLADYSATPMPDWGVPKNWCTDHGLKLAELFGKHLAEDLGIDPHNLRVISDNGVMRTGLTAASTLKGMGLQQATVLYDNVRFHSVKAADGAAVCKSPPAEVIAAERKKRFKQVSLPWNLTEALVELQGILGVGAAGPISDLGGLEFDDDGKPIGSVNLLRQFGQVLLYAYASKVPFAHASLEQLNRFIAWQDWYRSVADFHSLEATDNALLLRGVLESLSSSQPGAEIFVGHDDNVDGLSLILDLFWEAPPYMGGHLAPTPPNSGFLFERDLDTGALSLSYVYHAFNNSVAADDFKLDRSMIRNWSSIDDLWNFSVNQLDRFVGAKECFAGAASTTMVV